MTGNGLQGQGYCSYFHDDRKWIIPDGARIRYVSWVVSPRKTGGENALPTWPYRLGAATNVVTARGDDVIRLSVEKL
jgi:hypothetical protein